MAVKNKKAVKATKSNFKKFIPLYKFFGIFIGVIALYYIGLAVLNESIFEQYIKLTATLSGGLIKLFGEDVVINGVQIISDGFVIFLSFGCEGSEALMIFIAGVLAFPAKLKDKVYGLLFGGIFLYLMNLFRIVILYYIGKFNVGSFNAFHNEILPIFFIIFSLVVWGFWIKWTSRHSPAK